MSYNILKSSQIIKVTCDICGYTAVTDSGIPCNTGIREVEYDFCHMHYCKFLCEKCMKRLHEKLENKEI